MYDIITIGDAINDLFIVPHRDEVETRRNRFHEVKLCFEHGSKISIDEVHRDIGGSACNVAVGMSRLGFCSAIIAAVGTDREAEKIEERLKREGVESRYLKKFKENQTNFSVIIVYKGERTVFVYRDLKDYSLLKLPKSLNSFKWLYLGPVANSFRANYQQIIRLVSEKNVCLAINPGHRQIMEGREDLKRLIRLAKILILNREEAIDLVKMVGFPTVKDTLRRLKSFGAQIVVVTDREKGAYATDGENFYAIKAYSTEVVDSTGAGDAFSSGFLAGYISNTSEVKDYQHLGGEEAGGILKEALKWGIMNSSEVITDYGAQTNLSHWEQLQKLVDKAPDIYNL